jgi:hypothetical protein
MGRAGAAAHLDVSMGDGWLLCVHVRDGVDHVAKDLHRRLQAQRALARQNHVHNPTACASQQLLVAHIHVYSSDLGVKIMRLSVRVCVCSIYAVAARDGPLQYSMRM